MLHVQQAGDHAGLANSRGKTALNLGEEQSNSAGNHLVIHLRFSSALGNAEICEVLSYHAQCLANVSMIGKNKKRKEDNEP